VRLNVWLPTPSVFESVAVTVNQTGEPAADIGVPLSRGVRHTLW
jgi:hypothetical protein